MNNTGIDYLFWFINRAIDSSSFHLEKIDRYMFIIWLIEFVENIADF